MPILQLFAGILFLLSCFDYCNGSEPVNGKKGNEQLTGSPTSNFHTFSVSIPRDSVPKLHNQSKASKGIKPWIAPALLITTGTALHFGNEFKENIRDVVQENLAYQGKADDYGQYVPLATVYALYFSGIRGKNNFGNKTAIAIKSYLLNGIFTTGLKGWINETRPNGEARSFPSGHTSKAFTVAHFMHREYGDLSPWYSIGAYASASAVGMLRVAKNAHWFPDVVMGAGVGILSTELVYLTHQYKWDNQHLRRMDIFPFNTGTGKGVTLVYNF